MSYEELKQEYEQLKVKYEKLVQKYQKTVLLQGQQRDVTEKVEAEIKRMLGMIKDYQEQIEAYKVMEKEYKQLKSENERLKDKAQTQVDTKYRKEKITLTSARIVNLYLHGYEVEAIIDLMKKDYEKEISLSKVYRTISVKEDEDYGRILCLFKTYPKEFSLFNEEDIKKLFVIKRAKKLGLYTSLELIDKYGVDLVNSVMPTVEEDKFAKGYYDKKSFEREKQKRHTVTKLDDVLDEINMLGA